VAAGIQWLFVFNFPCQRGRKDSDRQIPSFATGRYRPEYPRLSSETTCIGTANQDLEEGAAASVPIPKKQRACPVPHDKWREFARSLPCIRGEQHDGYPIANDRRRNCCLDRVNRSMCHIGCTQLRFDTAFAECLTMGLVKDPLRIIARQWI
jgi:hypothetical protein